MVFISKFIIILVIVLAAICMSGAAYNWPMENGAIQLSKTNLSIFESPYFANNLGLSPGAIGPTATQTDFAKYKGEGDVPSGVTKKMAFVGSIVKTNDPRMGST